MELACFHCQMSPVDLGLEQSQILEADQLGPPKDPRRFLDLFLGLIEASFDLEVNNLGGTFWSWGWLIW